jgi:hypothetical protein
LRKCVPAASAGYIHRRKGTGTKKRDKQKNRVEFKPEKKTETQNETFPEKGDFSGDVG